MKKVAIIGAGVSGLYAAHRLSENFDVTLLERSTRVGGHAYTVPVGENFLDLAFLVFNTHSYPKFISWMEELDLIDEFHQVNMSFGIETQGLNYSISNGMKGLNFQGNAMKLKFWSILSEIKKYRKSIQATVELGEATLGDHFKAQGHSETFIKSFIYPLAISIWSLPGKAIDEMLAQTFCQFMGHHRFLKENHDSKWLTFKNSSKVYKDKILSKNKFRVETNADIQKIRELDNRIEINGSSFDACLVTTPADEAARLFTDEREGLLSQFTYQPLKATLHSSSSYMPKSKSTWSAWNIMERADSRFITYWLNNIRPIDSQENFFLTLGEEPKETEILHETTFRHLLLDKKAFDAQKKLVSLNSGNIAFAGSYFGKGFHEDAIEASCQAVSYLEKRLS